MPHFADRLLDACHRASAPICIGLDPVLDRLPQSLRAGVNPRSAAEVADAIETFCLGVIDAVADVAPCIKPQSACFERWQAPGWAAYRRIIAAARERGLIVISDVKRGDIGVSSSHYAAACLEDVQFDDLGPLPGPDAVTINSYLGVDGMQPFMEAAARDGKGVFVLVRTSNPGGTAIQMQPLAQHPSETLPRAAESRTVVEYVARLVAEAGRTAPATLGESGYSPVGAVVGATHPEDAARLRQIMSEQVFLVPGFGAQGAGPDDVRACFDSKGQGAIITASRSVIYAPPKPGEDDWKDAVRRAALEMKQQIAAIIGR